MANNLKLITTETFGDLSCNFYCNMDDDILLTREQIGLALEYSDPMVAIGKIHKRHKDRLDNLSFTILVNGHETYYYTDKGVMEICRWSKSDKANQFMDWVWDMFTLTLDSIMEKLHIAEDTDFGRIRNIFDELAAKIEKDLEK